MKWSHNQVRYSGTRSPMFLLVWHLLPTKYLLLYVLIGFICSTHLLLPALLFGLIWNKRYKCRPLYIDIVPVLLCLWTLLSYAEAWLVGNSLPVESQDGSPRWSPQFIRLVLWPVTLSETEGRDLCFDEGYFLIADCVSYHGICHSPMGNNK